MVVAMMPVVPVLLLGVTGAIALSIAFPVAFPVAGAVITFTVSTLR